MQDDKYFFKHDFMRTAMIGFVASLDNLFEDYKQHINNSEFPITITNTGDEVYLSNLTSIGNDNKEHYDQTPRISMSFSNISVEAEQLTAPGVVGKIIVKNKDNVQLSGLSHLRRIPLIINMNSEAVFSKIHEVLTFIEYYFSAVSHLSLGYEFQHNGLTHQATYDLLTSFDKESNLSLSFGSDKREHRLPLSFSLSIQLPAYNLYKAKGFNYLEEPGVFLDSENTIDLLQGCNNCNNCKECSDPNKNKGMVKILHRMHMSDPSPKGILSTTIIEN